MPGNEIVDRVHNFFEQEHLSQGQHHPQIADVNWAGVNNNRWDGSQRQYDEALSFKIKDCSPQQSDLEARNIHSGQVQYGLNSPPIARPGLADNRSHNQHPDLNGNIYGHQVFQKRPDEAIFLGVGTESDRSNSNGRRFSMYGPSQGSGAEHPATSGRMDSFESPVSYDFFGGQPKMNDHPGILQSLPQQHSGFSDMHQLQQQLMLRKMQELQRQEDIQQLHARQQHSVKQRPAFTRQVSGNNSHDFINGTPVSDTSHPWTTEMPAGNTHWLHHTSSAMQGSTGKLMFSPGQGQALNSVNLVCQQVDQSLPGIPISTMRDKLNQNQFAKDRPPLQMATYNNSFQSNHHAAFPQEVTMKDEHVNSRQGFQGKDLFGHTSHQGLSSKMNLENLKQLSSRGKNEATQEFQEKQKIIGPPEASHDKIAGQVPSKNSIALDPAEEKILFGSDDDSIWDAFGKKTDEGVSNLLDSTEFINGLPSIQSGSWSALMQSAVAETSSSDVGHQENWTSLSIQNPDLSTGNHQSSSYDAEKHHTALVNNNLPISSAFTFGSVAPSDDTNGYHNRVQGVVQFGHKVSQERIEGLQRNSSHRPFQQSLAGGSNWLNSKNQSYGSASHTVDADLNGRRYSNHWAPPQNGPSQPSEPHNWNVTNGVTPNGQNIHENKNFVRNYQNNGQKQVMHEALNLKDGIREVNSLSNSSAELEQMRCTTRSSLAGYSSNAAGAVLKSTKSTGSEESSFLDGWKPMETSLKTQESENSQKLEHLPRKGPHSVKSAFHSSEEEVNMQVMNTVSKKMNHNTSYRSTMFNPNFTAGPGESDLLDASDPQSLAGGKQKSSKKIDQKSAGPRKFQFHPMGNLDEDVELPYQMREAYYSKMMPLHNSQGFRSQEKGCFGQSNLLCQFSKGSIEKGKGQLPDHQEDTSRPDEVSLKGNLPGYVPAMSSAINKNVGMSTSYSSENMLELLYKVDQSKERSTEKHHPSMGHSSLSQTPEEESSDGTGGSLQDNQSSAAHGFGLQLAPPLQRPGLNNVSSSPSPTVKYSSSTQATVVGGDKGQRMLDPTAYQSMPSPREVGRREFKNNKTVIPGHTANEESPPKMQENFSSDSVFSYPKSQLQDQLISKASGQVSIDSHRRLGYQFAGNSVLDAASSAPYDETTSSVNISRPTPTIRPHDRVSADKISAGELLSVSQSITTTGTSSKGAPTNMLSSIWPNVTPQQRYVGAHDRHTQTNPIQSQQSDIVESTFSVPHNLVEQGPTLMDDFPSEVCTGSLHAQGLASEIQQPGKENSCLQVSTGSKDLIQKSNESPRKEPDIQQLHSAPPLNPPSTQRDIEAFGRTLKPNNFIQQNFSLVNQIRAMKTVGTDPSNRGSKRLKKPNNRLMAEQVTSRTRHPHEADVMVEDPPFSSSSVPSVDPKMRCFSDPEDNGGINASSYKIEKLPSQDVPAFDQIESENYRHGSSTASDRTEHPSISPQMAPSWFNQYGSFKNGQISQVYDASTAVTLKNVEHPFRQSFNNLHTESQEHTNAVADTNEIIIKQQNATPALLAFEHLSSLQSLPPDELCGDLVISRPKKRKCATSELQSWQKEVSQSYPDLQCLSVAEENWAKAAKQTSEKVEDDVDTIEAGLPMPRARRRLSLTRQLMQLLFPAPPEVILSAEARSSYETVTYFVARRTLGDTCSLMSSSDWANLQADKRKASDRSHEERTSQVMEDFTGRVRKLETELSRLDKRASVSDLRMEVQDVEKISIINRFAMFHSRLQADSANTSSLPGASANSQKPFPQRFVTAIPLPRNLPDSVQCLSL